MFTDTSEGQKVETGDVKGYYTFCGKICHIMSHILWHSIIHQHWNDGIPQSGAGTSPKYTSDLVSCLCLLETADNRSITKASATNI